MKKLLQKVKKIPLGTIGMMATFVITLAQSSSSLCVWAWAYEEELPDCLQNNI
jgi:cyclic lactone autoinducer peptide